MSKDECLLRKKKKQPADLASIVMNYATHAAVKNGFSHSTKINDYMKFKKNQKTFGNQHFKMINKIEKVTFDYRL